MYYELCLSLILVLCTARITPWRLAQRLVLTAEMNSTHPIWPGTWLLWVGKFSKISVGPVTAEGSRSPPRALFGQFWSKSRPTGDHTTFLCSKGPKHCPQMTGRSCLYLGSNLSVIICRKWAFWPFEAPATPAGPKWHSSAVTGPTEIFEIFPTHKSHVPDQIGCVEFVSAVKTRRWASLHGAIRAT